MNPITKNKFSHFFRHARSKLIIAGCTAAAVAAVGLFIVATHASGFFASVDPDQGTLTANAHIVNDAGASGGKAIQFTAPAVTPPTTPPPTTPPPSGTLTNCMPNPSRCGYPDATNTGVPAGTALTAVNGDMTISTANAVVDSKEVFGCINVTAPGVTIKRTKIHCDGSYGIYMNDQVSGASNTRRLTIQDSDIECLNIHETAIAYVNITVQRVYIHGGCENGGAFNDNTTVQDSYITDILEIHPELPTGTHGDGIQFAGDVANILIDHNSIIVGAVTSALNWTDPAVSFVAQNNLLSGGGYTVYCPRSATPAGSFQVINNRFAGSPTYGQTDHCTTSGVTFTGNYQDSTLQTVVPN